MKHFVLFVILLFFISEAFSQQQPFDTLSVNAVPLQADSLKSDTLQTKTDTVSSASGVDTIITYTCEDSIIYQIQDKTMRLYRNSKIDYQTLELKAEEIGIDWNTSIVTSQGVPDSTDTLHGGYRGTPVMKDGSEQYSGFKLTYNFQTRKGKIDVGDTKAGEGFYHGEDIKKVDTDVLFVGNGRFTTCDKPDPHFYFGSPTMKVVPSDQVIAEPVYFYIADVPVFALPFAVFPNKSGRRSGIIAPAYAEDAQRGRLLRHLGFYWAISDYMDYKVQTDLYTKGGFALATQYQYNLRYYLSGSLSGEYKNTHIGEDGDPSRSETESYNIKLYHNQEIDPTTHVNVDFGFASDNSYLNTIDRDQALEQSISSNATISKHWESPNSINLSVSRYQNLQSGNIDWTLPTLNFNHGVSYPFRRKKGGDAATDLQWYEMIGLNYGLNASNATSKAKTTVNNVKVHTGMYDTLVAVEEFQKTRRQRIGQSIAISIAPKVGYVTISPSLSFNDSRDFSETDIPVADVNDSTLTFTNKREASRAGHLTSGISFNTRLFGIVQPNTMGIAAIRHTLSPSLGLTYDKQVYGDNMADKNIYASLNIGNVFEMKTISDEEGKEGEKIQLLNVGLSTAYNFTAESLQVSPLRMNFSTRIGSFLDISGGTGFDFYQLQTASNGSFQRVNTFLLSSEGRLARMTDLNFSLSTSLSGQKKSSKQQGTSTGDSTTPQTPQLQRQRSFGELPEPDFSIPWQLRLQWHFSEQKSPPGGRSSSMDASLDFNLTEKWKFGVRSGYDFVAKDFVYPQMTISRDLHCWVMNFSWTPIGLYRSYQFEIRVKASGLQDLKVTKSGSDIGY